MALNKTAKTKLKFSAMIVVFMISAVVFILSAYEIFDIRYHGIRTVPYINETYTQLMVNLLPIESAREDRALLCVFLSSLPFLIYGFKKWTRWLNKDEDNKVQKSAEPMQEW